MDTTKKFQCIACRETILIHWVSQTCTRRRCQICGYGPLCGECYDVHPCANVKQPVRPRDRDEE